MSKEGRHTSKLKKTGSMGPQVRLCQVCQKIPCPDNQLISWLHLSSSGPACNWQYESSWIKVGTSSYCQLRFLLSWSKELPNRLPPMKGIYICAFLEILTAGCKSFVLLDKCRHGAPVLALRPWHSISAYSETRWETNVVGTNRGKHHLSSQQYPQTLLDRSVNK